MRINPSDAGDHATLGRVYAQQGRLEDAVKELWTAARLGSEEALRLLRPGATTVEEQ